MIGRPKFKLKDEVALFEEFCNGASINQLCHICNCSFITMRSYVRRNKWEQRREKLKEKVTNKIDDDKASRIARQVKLARQLQETGSKYIDKTDISKFTAGTAVTAIVEGVRIEREVLGDDEEKKQPQQIELVLSPEFAKLMGVADRKTVHSTVVIEQPKELESADENRPDENS